MHFRKTLSARLRRAAALVAALGLLASAFAQEPAPPQGPGAAEDDDEVVRISTELVQVDVVVLDREGRFVEGLKREDFEVTVDGRPQVLGFFEGVAAGSREERAALGRARGSRP